MAFSTSVNIERDFGKVTPYIVTANARQAIGKIVCHFADGIHSFCLIGSYGTGKSSFIVALENCMRGANSDKDSLILDFFSGSGTTAHAVMKLNAEDGGNRKFIMVQLPEVCAETSEAYKAGYKNICEIGKERIRRAGQKIKDESPLTTQNLDVGFRVLKIVDKD